MKILLMQIKGRKQDSSQYNEATLSAIKIKLLTF